MKLSLQPAINFTIIYSRQGLSTVIIGKTGCVQLLLERKIQSKVWGLLLYVSSNISSDILLGILGYTFLRNSVYNIEEKKIYLEKM